MFRFRVTFHANQYYKYERELRIYLEWFLVGKRRVFGDILNFGTEEDPKINVVFASRRIEKELCETDTGPDENFIQLKKRIYQKMISNGSILK